MTQQINLLERSLLHKREWVTGRSVVLVGGLLVGALAAQFAYESHALKAVLAATTTAVPAGGAVATRDDMEQQISAAQAKLQGGELLMTAVAGLIDLPTNNAERLQALFNSLPEGVWLQEVEFSGQRSVRIVGGAMQPGGVAQLSATLGGTAGFQRLPVHLFELGLEKPKADDAGDGQTASPRPAGPRHFGFVLSSANAGAAAKGTP